MASEHRRGDRVAEAIREEVATFLATEVKDPRVTGLVTVTGCEVTRDLRHAKVFVSIMGTDAERAGTLEGLASVATHLRSRVGRALQLRLAPEIKFHADESIARAARIEDLLAQIKDSQPAADARTDAPADGEGNG
jgi:ribosome-binding factor A